MGVSQKRREQRAKRLALKKARLANPGRDSRYARKLRGIYPPRSPYLTGDFGRRMRALAGPVEITAVPSPSIYPPRQHGPESRHTREDEAAARRWGFDPALLDARRIAATRAKLRGGADATLVRFLRERMAP